jgi:hypothetical protein
MTTPDLKYRISGKDRIKATENHFEVSRHRCAVCSLPATGLFQNLSLHQNAKKGSEHGQDHR